MSTLNHDRPILRLIDDLKKERSTREDAPSKESTTNINKIDEKRRIHDDAMKCLEHLIKHKNINVVPHFISDERCGKHADLLKKWFSEFGRVKFNAVGEISYDRTAKFRLAEAREMPFWKFAEPKIKQAFDLFDELSKLVDRADRRRMRPVPGDKISVDALNEIRGILKKWTG